MLTETRTWVVATRRSAHGRVTIADVAREAGVHKGTVSRALRGFSGVGTTTRERILEAADRLEFTASPVARALATGQSKTIGIVLPTMRSWYFSEVAAGASESLIPSGFRVELINLDVDSDYLDTESPQFHQLFNELGAGRGRDALLFAGTISIEENQHHQAAAQVPAALIGMPLTSVPGIFIDHREGGRLAGRHLVELGHQEIGVLDGRMHDKVDTHVWEQRTDGLRDAVRQAGLDVANNMVLHPGDCHADDGARAMQSMLDSGRRLPSAIFCHTDEMAFGALSVMRRAGLRCPDDLSVVGFDDHPMSRFWGLTTVSQHAHEQGVRAAAALLAAMGVTDRPASAEEADVLKVQLIVRETTAGR